MPQHYTLMQYRLLAVQLLHNPRTASLHMQEKDPFFARQIRPGLRSGLFGSSGHGIIKQAAGGADCMQLST